jgi:hypothetical protein
MRTHKPSEYYPGISKDFKKILPSHTFGSQYDDTLEKVPPFCCDRMRERMKGKTMNTSHAHT